MMLTDITPLERLATWFERHCNGDWEHSYGITIESLDNPGWALHVELADTEMADAVFTPMKHERSKDDWVHCSVENAVFHGYGGIHNLDEMIVIFLNWVAIEEK